MENISREGLFKDYYLNNKGSFFKSFKITIGIHQYSYDVYWGDPNIVFDKKSLEETCPLAIAIMPHRYNYPNSRIFLHEKLEKKFKNVFEVVVAHEIGHLWLHDIVGFNNPSTTSYMNEKDSETWSDYFAYCFFQKYRNITCLEDFSKVLEEASSFQMKIYNLNTEQHIEATFTNKLINLKQLDEIIELNKKDERSPITQMKNAIEITLNNLEDIFIS